MRLEARRRFLGTRKGAHPSLRRGTSLEFADYRSYTPGDDPRHVDWGLYSRTRRLYTRLYQEEEDLNAYIFVDTSASMRVPAEARKDEAATHIALALAYAVLSSDDSVRLLRLTGKGSETTPFYRGRRRILEINEFLERDRPTARLALASAIASGLRTIRRPGKAILLSDMLFPVNEIEQGLDLLRAANLDILIIQTLGATEIDPPLSGPERLVDIETGEFRDLHFDEAARGTYLENLDRHTREVRSLCHRSGIQFVRYDTSKDLDMFVLAELPALGIFH